MYISNNAVIANMSVRSLRPLSRLQQTSEPQSGDDFDLDHVNLTPNKASKPAHTPRSLLAQELLEQILEMIGSNDFDEDAFEKIKQTLSKDGNGTIGHLIDMGA